MKIQRSAIVVTTGTTAAGTATTPFPINGRVVEVRLPSAATALTTGSTATFTITRVLDGGTVLAITAAAAPFQYQPRNVLHTTTGGTTVAAAGTSAWLDQFGPPVDDYLSCVVTQGGTSVSGTVFVFHTTGG